MFRSTFTVSIQEETVRLIILNLTLAVLEQVVFHAVLTLHDALLHTMVLENLSGKMALADYSQKLCVAVTGQE